MMSARRVAQVEQSNSELSVSVDAEALAKCVCFANRSAPCRMWLELFGRQLSDDDAVSAAATPRKSTADAPHLIQQQQPSPSGRTSRVQRLELVDRTLFQHWLLAKFRVELF